MIRVVILFLVILAGISMIGNIVTKFLHGPPEPPPKLATRAKCGNCGRTVIGTTPCVCGKG